MKQRKKLSSGKWLGLLAGTLVLIVALVAVLNILVDPYGAFGDPIFGWWSYNETLNPRMAKITYLEQHPGEFDSFIVGSSGASAYSVEELNQYLDANFYNCFFYGTDMYAYEQIVDYLLETQQPKNLLLDLTPKIGMAFDMEADSDLTKTQHYHVDGSSAIGFYLKYAFINPMDSVQKIQKYATDPYLQQAYRCFNADTGAYDKSSREAESIGDLESYLQREEYSGFTNFPKGSIRLSAIDESVASVGRIVKKCEENGVNLIVTLQPFYTEALAYYDNAELATFRAALATVTDYWDFTLSSVSFEPRYFYDETHFRNDVGSMALARIFGNENAYVPADFGEYVAKNSNPGGYSGAPADPADYSAQVPILLYHHLVTGTPENDDQINAETFRTQLTALKNAGWQTVDFYQLRAYVENGAELPEKAFLITFDDGYASNFELAYPVLKELDFQATFYAIGVSVGKDTYKDTGEPMTPHYSIEQAREMEASGLITVASHGYNIHEVNGRDANPIREGILQREDESEKDYVNFLNDDCARMYDLLGENAALVSFPESRHDKLSEVILYNNGVWSTVTTERKVNTVLRGLPQSLYLLGRFSVNNNVTAEELLDFLSGND